jgi:predicted RNA-binding Zn ribbon-like protein
VARVNGFLAAGGTYQELIRAEAGLNVRERRVWNDWTSLVTSVAEAVTDLFVQGDPTLMRQCDCETCPLWFYDRTKSHRRRWCSMGTCGSCRSKGTKH